ncbi:DUF7674 family protein [Niabella ginsenosidivorans]|nr:hypothetical protein [Niabella ginsenosidivorans]
MNQYEIPAMIEDKIPGICPEIKKISAFGDAVQIMNVLAGYSKKMLSLHNLPKVIQCMRLVGTIYGKGNRFVKSAIENVFVFSFSSWQAKCNDREWKVIQTKIPVTLYSVYVQQMSTSGL